MKPSLQGCRIGKSYKVIQYTSTCFSSPPLVWRNGPNAMYTELDYNAICKQCGQKFKDHNKKIEVPACLSKGIQWK